MVPAHEIGEVMADQQVFTSRLRGRPLLDSEGVSIGRVRDVVILPSARGETPRALGLVVALQRRRIFVNFGRVAEMSLDGAHLRGGAVDLDRFVRRTGEILASDLYNRPTADGAVADVAICPSERRAQGWEVCTLAIAHGRGLLPRSTVIMPWDSHPELFKAGALAEQLADLREMNPTDLASAIEGMSPTRRGQLADVVEEMEPDDAADVLAEMPAEQRERLLTAMEAAPAADLRRLLRYDARTAGGLMTSQPLIVPPNASVAEVLASIRQPEVRVTAAAQVHVCEPPTLTPTG